MNSDEKPLTGVRKRQQIDSARKQMLIWVAVAAAAVVVCIEVGINLFQRIQYQGKVNKEISATEKAMKDNVDAINPLIKSVNTLKTNKLLNLQNLKADNSTVFQVVIDALPTEDDSVSLGSSLQERILSRSGVSIKSITVSDSDSSSVSTDETTTSDTDSDISMPKAQPITFTVGLEGSYSAIQSTLSDIENSIRPIVINSLSVEGKDADLTVNITATTYYSPSVEFKMGTKEVQP